MIDTLAIYPKIMGVEYVIPGIGEATKRLWNMLPSECREFMDMVKADPRLQEIRSTGNLDGHTPKVVHMGSYGRCYRCWEWFWHPWHKRYELLDGRITLGK